MHDPFYITTPIYYVNDRPHIGHCFTTLLADIAARFERLIRGGGDGVFFLTGTDEHADRVVTTAAERGLTPIQWADHNADQFRQAFELVACSHDDFIRTTQDRHKSKVGGPGGYIERLLQAGDVYKGDYTGWYDVSQDEYLTETVAKEHGYASPVTGKPLVRRTERNYFFRLSKYEGALGEYIAANPGFIAPPARRNEVLGRLREGLQDVPISRAVTSDPASQWGILMPGDEGHRIYVWIDALFNYLSAVDTEDRRRFWPPTTHVMAKDILWFHAVIWPCLLMALGLPLPRRVFAHSYWVREGRKMSKSLGNFVDLDVIRAYIGRFGVDAWRWHQATQGPISNTDADFTHSKFVEVYNADLANGIGNCASRVGNMIAKYFDGRVPDGRAGGGVFEGEDLVGGAPRYDLAGAIREQVAGAIGAARDFRLDEALQCGRALVRYVDDFISAAEPFRLAKKTDQASRERLARVLYACAEGVRCASLLLSPALPGKMGSLWSAWGCEPPGGVGLEALTSFGGAHSLVPGAPLSKGEALFMRADPAEPAPDAPKG